jgi:predicted metal-dependent hydrolase
MVAEAKKLVVGGIEIKVFKKPIKNLHLSVHPPDGWVRVSAPLHLSEDAIRLAVIKRLSWIKRHRERMRSQPRESAREMVNRESHYFLGKRYLLQVVEGTSPQRVEISGSVMRLFVRPGADRLKRQRILNEWYRRELKALLPGMISEWERKMGVSVNEWGIKRMKTKWGSCNPAARRIWLNLELAKKPPHLVEYVLVHEIAHFFEGCHNDHFKALMDKFLPNWRLHRDELAMFPILSD